MENIQTFENLDEIMTEAKGFVDIPVEPKTKTAEEIAEREQSIREKYKIREPKKVEPVHVDRAERKAALKLAGRVTSGAIVAAGSVMAEVAGLMDVRLALPLGVAALAFVAFWIGAGVQWKFGGLIDG